MTFLVEQIKMMNDEVIRIFEAETLEDAIVIAKSTIDEYLERYRDYHAFAGALFAKYLENGLKSSIFDGQTLSVYRFDHLSYAWLQCLEVFREQAVSLPSHSLNLN